MRSGSLRHLALPRRTYERLERGDALWVREGMTVLPKQERRDALDLLYAGERQRRSVPWIASVVKPGPGARPADAMPVQCSRCTLSIERVSVERLAQIPEELAAAAGALPHGDGWGAAGYPFMAPMLTSTEALQFLHEQMFEGAEPNPEVSFVTFRPIMRNIGLLTSRAGAVSR